MISLVTPDIESYPVFRWTVDFRRGVTRPRGSQVRDVWLEYYPDLSQVTQVWPSFPNLLRDMQVKTSCPLILVSIPFYEPYHDRRRDIPGYPDLLFQMGE